MAGLVHRAASCLDDIAAVEECGQDVRSPIQARDDGPGKEDCQEHDQRRTKAADAAFVEPAQADSAGRAMLIGKDRCDQEAREDEEQVHADESTALEDPGWLEGVADDDEGDRDAADTVELATVLGSGSVGRTHLPVQRTRPGGDGSLTYLGKSKRSIPSPLNAGGLAAAGAMIRSEAEPTARSSP